MAPLKVGSAYHAPGLAVAEMVEAISKDNHKILPYAAHLKGEYGIVETHDSVPIQLGSKVMEKIGRRQESCEGDRAAEYGGCSVPGVRGIIAAS